MRLLLTGLVFVATFAPQADSPRPNRWTLHPLTIDPIAPGRRDIFAGEGKIVRVEFRNDSDSDPVRVFPEPPLTIRRLKADTSCQIDGGVWVRNAVFLSEDEKFLVVLEFSGESNHLRGYNTETCKQQGDLDVSGARWGVNGSEITIGTHCTSHEVSSCKSKRVVPVSKFLN